MMKKPSLGRLFLSYAEMTCLQMFFNGSVCGFICHFASRTLRTTMITKNPIFILISILLISGCTLEVKDCKDGATRCVGDSVNTCMGGEWIGYSPCTNQKCEEKDGIATCVHICEPGNTKCSGNVLLTCTEEYTWPTVSRGMECAEDESCMSMQGFAFCANPNSASTIVEILSEHDVECNGVLRMCGENNSLYTCDNDELKELEQCGSQICGQNDEGDMVCLDMHDQSMYRKYFISMQKRRL